MPRRGGGTNQSSGGVISYPLENIYEEVAFISYHFNWSHDEVMKMEHADRRQWVSKISQINNKMNQSMESQLG